MKKCCAEEVKKDRKSIFDVLQLDSYEREKNDDPSHHAVDDCAYFIRALPEPEVTEKLNVSTMLIPVHYDEPEYRLLERVAKDACDLVTVLVDQGDLGLYEGWGLKRALEAYEAHKKEKL